MNEEEIVNPIVIHTHLLQKFMRHGKDYANLLALYSFYLYEAKKQETNQPLATDDYTRKGMNWALDRVKRTKRILKDMEVIGMVQRRKYSYVRLFFIYTKKKICEILGNVEITSKEETKEVELVKEVKKEEPKEQERVKSLFEEKLIEKKIKHKRIDEIRATILSVKDIEKYKFNSIALAIWIIYCENTSIKYSKTHVKNWLEKMNGRTTIEQYQAVYNAVNKKWKDFYLVEIKKSIYHSFLGKSLMMEKEYKTLLDLNLKDGIFTYQFENARFSTKHSPDILFEEYGYKRQNKKSIEIATKVKEKILSAIKRF